MQITKTDLLESGYHWSATNTEEMTEHFEPSRKLYDRYNGNQLVAMIGYYININGPVDSAGIHAIEKLLLDQLPIGIKSEKSVYAWLTSQQF